MFNDRDTGCRRGGPLAAGRLSYEIDGAGGKEDRFEAHSPIDLELNLPADWRR